MNPPATPPPINSSAFQETRRPEQDCRWLLAFLAGLTASVSIATAVGALLMFLVVARRQGPLRDADAVVFVLSLLALVGFAQIVDHWDAFKAGVRDGFNAL